MTVNLAIAASRVTALSDERSATRALISRLEDALMTTTISRESIVGGRSSAAVVVAISAMTRDQRRSTLDYCTLTTRAARRFNRRVSSRELSNFGRSSP